MADTHPLPVTPQTLLHATPPSTAPTGDAEFEQHLDDWRWIFKGREEGWLTPSEGQHVAVVNQRVIASDPSTMMRMETTHAKMGRLIKNCAMKIP